MSLKIAVLLGGTSAERDVSLASGIAIAKALAQNGHRVKAVDCAFGARLIEDWNQNSGNLIQLTPSAIDKKRIELNRNILDTMRYLMREKFDLVFIALHGGYGENGEIQAMLDLLGIPYTGSNPLASALGMNKHLSKILFRNNHIPTAPWVLLDKTEKLKSEQIHSIGYPVAVKPNDQGSTVGLTIVSEPELLWQAINRAFEYSRSVIIEKFINGREMTVSMLGEEPLPVIEIVPEHGIYDYECKYQQGKSQYIVPAQLNPEVTAKLQEYARKAFKILGCRHFGRVDFRLRNNRDPYCLEVNTLPGMTSTSLVPKAARTKGLDFPDLLEKIAQMAIG